MRTPRNGEARAGLPFASQSSDDVRGGPKANPPGGLGNRLETAEANGSVGSEGPGESKLESFAAVPRRVFEDQRLRLRHLRVLGTICGVVNAVTGRAKIRQVTISEKTAVPRSKISAVVSDLVKWGYLRKSKPVRKRGGHYKTLSYEVLYRDPRGGRVSRTYRATPKGSTDHATFSVGTAVSPERGQESEYCESYPNHLHHQKGRDDAGGGVNVYVGFLASVFTESRRRHFPSANPISGFQTRSGAGQLWARVLDQVEEHRIPLRKLQWDQARLARVCAEIMDQRMLLLARDRKGPPSSPLFCHLSVESELISLRNLIA